MNSVNFIDHSLRCGVASSYSEHTLLQTITSYTVHNIRVQKLVCYITHLLNEAHPELTQDVEMPQCGHGGSSDL